MKFRVALLVPAVGALVAGLLVASPAEAARSQLITGTITGPGGAGSVGPIRVELIEVVRGGNTKVVRFANGLGDGSAYSFKVALNGKKKRNKASKPYRLRISTPAAGGGSRSWYWRGRNGATTGGGRHLRDASVVTATKGGAFRADFRYSSISGTAPQGAQVTVAGAPATYKGGRDARRELDMPGCANVFATSTVTNGTYRADFLPYLPGDKRYMVSVRAGGDERWNNSFGSCFDVQNYRYSRANMLALEPAGLNYPVTAGATGNTLTVAGKFSGFKATVQGDRWVSLREAQPAVAILDSPVVAEKRLEATGTTTFGDLPPGRYYVELGRRTGCADWYPSRYSNNNTYFKGLDRSAERWKTFPYLSKLQGNRKSGLERRAREVQPNPATDAAQGKRPGGAAGWMYRTHCKALGYGRVSTIDIAGTGTSNRVSLRSKRGGVVKGHVSRAKGRTNKEMLVTLSSTDGKRVLRTDLTDGGGNFYVAGLAPGRYKISVNADSWRGIGKKFKGRQFITVKAGRTRNAGNLRFTD